MHSDAPQTSFTVIPSGLFLFFVQLKKHHSGSCRLPLNAYFIVLKVGVTHT